MQEVVGVVREVDSCFPYGDPSEDRENMTIALGEVAAMAWRRSFIMRQDSRARSMKSLKIRQVIGHLLGGPLS